MESVWIIVEDGIYENGIVGIFSSKKKAEATMNAMNHIGSWGALSIKEFAVDSFSAKVMLSLEQEIDDYEEAKQLLEKLKES